MVEPLLRLNAGFLDEFAQTGDVGADERCDLRLRHGLANDRALGGEAFSDVGQLEDARKLGAQLLHPVLRRARRRIVRGPGEHVEAGQARFGDGRRLRQGRQPRRGRHRQRAQLQWRLGDQRMSTGFTTALRACGGFGTTTNAARVTTGIRVNERKTTTSSRLNGFWRTSSTM